MEISEYVKEFDDIWYEIEKNGRTGWDKMAVALGILVERAKDRRMAEIRAERMRNGAPLGQPAKPASEPPKRRTLEEARRDLGQLAGAVELSVGVDGVYIKVKKGPDFNNAVKKIKELGGKYHPETYEWVI